LHGCAARQVGVWAWRDAHVTAANRAGVVALGGGEWAAKQTPTNLPAEKPKHPLVEGVVGEVVGSLLDLGQWLSL
jgi:hypothetical protein